MMTEWPKLEYTTWRSTYETLHRWLQIAGKLRLCKSPWTNHSWNTTFYLTARGLTTSTIPLEERTMTLDFDFFDHELQMLDSRGNRYTITLKNESVASFYSRFQEGLKAMDVEATFEPKPNEVVDAIPFDQDQTHATYDRGAAFQWFQVLVRCHNVLQEFRSNFVGKSSPVHFFWGSFDLAVTRFSGRRAPEHPGGIPHLSDEVVREAYSHEVMSCGFWPGNEMYPHAAFYAYAYPEPVGLNKSRIEPPEAFYHQDLKEFILPYDVIRTSSNPAETIMKFLNSTYRSVANIGNWDRDLLEVSPHLFKLKELSRSSFGGEATRQ